MRVAEAAVAAVVVAWVLAVEAAAEAAEAVEEVEEVVVPTSVDKLARRKAERRRQHQRESLYPHLVGDHYCG